MNGGSGCKQGRVACFGQLGLVIFCPRLFGICHGDISLVVQALECILPAASGGIRGWGMVVTSHCLNVSEGVCDLPEQVRVI